MHICIAIISCRYVTLEGLSRPNKEMYRHQCIDKFDESAVRTFILLSNRKYRNGNYNGNYNGNGDGNGNSNHNGNDNGDGNGNHYGNGNCHGNDNGNW